MRIMQWENLLKGTMNEIGIKMPSRHGLGILRIKATINQRRVS